MATHIGFWLNLDAERELENPRDYRPDPRIQARIAGLVTQLTGLLGEYGRVIGSEPVAPGAAALAWCPTPSAQRGIAAHGLKLRPQPPLAILQRVNHRGFCASLGQTLPGATQVGDMQALRECIRQPSPTGDWILKRPYGFAGRERRRAIGGVLDPSTEGFARATLGRGDTLQVEPWVQRHLDLSVHGWVQRDGRHVLSAPVRFQCDGQGRFQRACGPAAAHLDASLLRELNQEGTRVAVALGDAGYFGPFGVDAFTYVDSRGRTCLNPRSEINARFTMGYVWPEGIDPLDG